MASPTATTRVTPTGRRLYNGHRTTIAFSRDPDVNLWEIGVQPPGYDGGDPVDTTTMHNSTHRTKNPRTLIDMTDASCTCAYDPLLYTQILTLINQEGSVTIRFSDGSTVAFWGYLRTFEPDECVEGEMPTATVSVTATNLDPSLDVEATPLVTEVAGT